MSNHDPSLVEKVKAALHANRINATGIGELGCVAVEGWHSWAAHNEHVALAALDAVADDLRTSALEGAAAWLASARPLDEDDPAHAAFNAAIDEVRYYAEHDPWGVTS